MRYICIRCEAGGAGSAGEKNNYGTLSFNCHVCPGQGTMWPEPQAKEYLTLLANNKRLKGLVEERDTHAVGVLEEFKKCLEGVCESIESYGDINGSAS